MQFIMESRSGYTALKALAMAHGATRLAKLSRAVIVRQTPKGVQEIPVPLDKIAKNQAPDTELLARRYSDGAHQQGQDSSCSGSFHGAVNRCSRRNSRLVSAC